MVMGLSNTRMVAVQSSPEIPWPVRNPGSRSRESTGGMPSTNPDPDPAAECSSHDHDQISEKEV